MKIKNKKRFCRRCGFFLFGVIVGFGYYAIIGCKSGTCLISGNPYVSSVYGGVLFYLIGLLLERKDRKDI